MKLHLDTSMMDEILRQWDGAEDYSAVYEMPVFREMLRHTEDFNRRKISPEEYLADFMRNAEMKSRRAEIEQNLAIIRSVDLNRLASQIAACLPPLDEALEFTIHPFMGRAGQALWDKVAIDVVSWPEPCDPDEFLNRCVLTLIRHEVHHLGYMRLRRVADIGELTTRSLLAADFILNMQMEGGAEVCGGQNEGRPLNGKERERLREGVIRYHSLTARWLSDPDGEITEADFDDYYTLWGQDSAAYWMGEYGCRALIESSQAADTAACMAMEPQEWFDRLCALFEQTTNGGSRHAQS